MNFVAIDFETANEKLSSICSMGIAVVKDSKVIEIKQYLIQPPDLNFNTVNFMIHGISKEDVKDKPKFNDLWNSLNKYFNEVPIVAHNASFDMSALRKTLDEYLIPYPEIQYACTLAISKKVWPDLTSYKLDSLSSLLEIELDHHNSVSDALACALITLKAANELSAISFEELLNKVQVDCGLLYPGGYTPLRIKHTKNEASDVKNQKPRMKESKKFNSRAEIEKLLNTLTGILHGITLDKEINLREIEELNHWCNYHRKYEKMHPFCELFPILDRAIQERFLSKEEIQDIHWLTKKLINSNEFYNQVSTSMQILHGILHGLLADNFLNDEEILKLNDWIDEHSYLNGTYPYDEINTLLKSVLFDGVIDEDEREMLKAFFGEFIDINSSYNLNQNELNDLKNKYNVNGLCTTCPNVTFDGTLFCFTGNSAKASRNEIKGLIEQAGGSFSNSVTKKTDFLVVGDEGSECWLFACYGRKVEKAMVMRKDGHKISIIHEKDFWNALNDLEMVGESCG